MDTSRPGSRRAGADTGSSRWRVGSRFGRHPSRTTMPEPLDDERNGERDREADEHALPRLLFELLAADVAEHRGVGRPQPTRDEVVPEETVPGQALRVAGRERDRRTPERDEPRNDDDVAPAFLELLLGPVEALQRLLVAEQPLHRPLSRELADAVRDVVADHGARPGGED